MAVSLLLALSLVNQPTWNDTIIINHYLETQKFAYFSLQAITVDCPHNYIANISTGMAARQRSESKLF